MSNKRSVRSVGAVAAIAAALFGVGITNPMSSAVAGGAVTPAAVGSCASGGVTASPRVPGAPNNVNSVSFSIYNPCHIFDVYGAVKCATASGVALNPPGGYYRGNQVDFTVTNGTSTVRCPTGAHIYHWGYFTSQGTQSIYYSMG